MQTKVLAERDVGEIWADLLEEETLAKVWPNGDGKGCTLEGRIFIMRKIPEVRNLGTTQRTRGRNTRGAIWLQGKGDLSLLNLLLLIFCGFRNQLSWM